MSGRRKQGRNGSLLSSMIAAYCQVSKTTVLRWIKEGKLVGFRLPSGHYRVYKEDFRDFLEKYHMPLKEWLFESESEKKEVPVAEEEIPDLEAKLLSSINEHPGGVTLAEVADSLGVVHIVLGRASRSLLEKGKIGKEDKLYFPVASE